MKPLGYDIIGDIHGHAEALENLLHKLDYKKTSEGGYVHPERKVIFLGDFIDRGEHLRQHKQLLSIIIPMVNQGHALAVMGNHEFNALAFHQQHQGRYLREHSEKNTQQHQAFLNEYSDDDPAKKEVLDFFIQLPLFLDLGELRIIHACWDPVQIEVIKDLTKDCKLDQQQLVEANTVGSPLFQAIEILLKGQEVRLPEGITLTDKDRHIRNTMRVQWWNNDAQSLAELGLPLGSYFKELEALPIPEYMPNYPEDAPPCFIGHYWFKGSPEPILSNLACLDYSIAKDGKLMSYRWSGESELVKENFIFC